ncbi:MAG: hypothetical protein QOH93_237 [Chloroflexia bacterium]|jgi:hypothetical protein|nr:hypothetical protein [Chloroflexia bacterium]
MPDRDFSKRDIVDKLGIKPGSVVAFDERYAPLDQALRRKVLERTGCAPAGENEVVEVVLVPIHAGVDAAGVLLEWRGRIRQNGGIWLLTPKRGQPGYVNQNDLIEAGAEANVVDNKTCSVDETTSGIRFVIRLADRTG